MGQEVKLNLQSHLLPRGGEAGLKACGSKPQPSSPMAGVSVKANPRPESPPSHRPSAGPGTSSHENKLGRGPSPP